MRATLACYRPRGSCNCAYWHATSTCKNKATGYYVCKSWSASNQNHKQNKVDQSAMSLLFELTNDNKIIVNMLRQALLGAFPTPNFINEFTHNAFLNAQQFAPNQMIEGNIFKTKFCTCSQEHKKAIWGDHRYKSKKNSIKLVEKWKEKANIIQ